MADKAPRRHFSPQDKVAILKRHLLEGVPVSNLCDQFGINPTVFYFWQRVLFENAHLSFDNPRKTKTVENTQQRKIQLLEAKIQRKNEVMAELMEALTQEKKRTGEP